MSNHFSAAYLNFPDGDTRLDFTDLFVFAPDGQPDQTVLIVDVNPYMHGLSATPPMNMRPEFHPDAVYTINVDTDGDSRADVAFYFTFSAATGGVQAATVRYATGVGAREREPNGDVLITDLPVSPQTPAGPLDAGGLRLFIGVRSDPFFADAEGALHGYKWTGHDDFAGKNILSMALMVPNAMLGDTSVIGVWGTVSVRRDGVPTQVDRGGHPTLNPFINPDYAKDDYNAANPIDDVATYLQPWTKILQDAGYPADEARAAAHTVLPDILTYDRGQPASYPNGRTLTDQVFDIRNSFLTHGSATSDGLEPHDDYLPEFPYLGPPNSLEMKLMTIPVPSLSLQSARAIIAAGEAKANEIGQPSNIAVVDAGGNLIAHIRMDGAWLGSIDISINKAFTARAFDLPTGELAKDAAPGEQFYGIHASNHGRVMIFAGGVPVKSEGQVIGAVGVSGGTGEQDQAVADAAAAAFTGGTA